MTDDPRNRPPNAPRGGTRAPVVNLPESPREPHIPPGGMPFGRYALLRRISYGGMGEIFLAKQAGLGSFKKLLVIKRLLSHYRGDADIVKMFFDEAKLQSAMADRHIVQIWDMGEVDEHYFIAMEYVQGQSWRRLIERLKERAEHIHPAHAVDLAVQVCRGLSYAHNLVDGDGEPLSVVHRDINPQNVLLSYDGECKIIDFGIAKSALSGVHTEEGTIKGKFAYMAPEQARAEPLDRRSDIFAFGICMYELLTTKNPFYRKNVVLSLEAICEKQVPPLEQVRPAVAAISPVIERCLMKNPDERFADMSEVGDALAGVYKDGLLGEPPESLPEWLHEVFEEEINEQARFLLANGFSSITLKRPSSSSDPNLQSPYGVGAEITSRKARALGPRPTEIIDYELPHEPPTAPPTHGDTHPTATLALDNIDIVSNPMNLAPETALAARAETTAEQAARVALPGEFSEDTEAPQVQGAAPVAARGCGLLLLAAFTAVVGAVCALYAFLVWDLPDKSPQVALAHFEALLDGVEAPSPVDPSVGQPSAVAEDAGAAKADAGNAATVDPVDDKADAGTEVVALVTPPDDDTKPPAPTGDADAGAAATPPETATDDDPGAEGDRTRGKRHSRRRRGDRTPPTETPTATPDPPPPTEAVMVGVVTVNAGGPFRISGSGVGSKNVARVKLAAGKAKTVTISGGPMELKLRLEDVGGALSVRIGAEPWAIVRVSNIGKGRTPLTLSVGKGGRLTLELKSPKAGDMRVTLGYAAP